MPLNKIEQMKLRMLREEYGDLSCDEALELAIQSEQILSDIGPFDPAAKKFIRDKLAFENMALLLERERTAASI